MNTCCSDTIRSRAEVIFSKESALTERNRLSSAKKKAITLSRTFYQEQSARDLVKLLSRDRLSIFQSDKANNKLKEAPEPNTSHRLPINYETPRKVLFKQNTGAPKTATAQSHNNENQADYRPIPPKELRSSIQKRCLSSRLSHRHKQQSDAILKPNEIKKVLQQRCRNRTNQRLQDVFQNVRIAPR